MDKAHLFFNNCIYSTLKTTDNYMFCAKSLDCSNATDNLFRRLCHSSKSFLGALGLEPYLRTKPLDKEGNKQKRTKSG